MRVADIKVGHFYEGSEPGVVREVMEDLDRHPTSTGLVPGQILVMEWQNGVVVEQRTQFKLGLARWAKRDVTDSFKRV